MPKFNLTESNFLFMCLTLRWAGNRCLWRVSGALTTRPWFHVSGWTKEVRVQPVNWSVLLWPLNY